MLILDLLFSSLLQGLIGVPSSIVDPTNVVEGGGLTSPVSHLLYDGQGLVVVLQGLS
jgi:hypothetical protein